MSCSSVRQHLMRVCELFTEWRQCSCVSMRPTTRALHPLFVYAFALPRLHTAALFKFGDLCVRHVGHRQGCRKHAECCKLQRVRTCCRTINSGTRHDIPYHALACVATKCLKGEESGLWYNNFGKICWVSRVLAKEPVQLKSWNTLS